MYHDIYMGTLLYNNTIMYVMYVYGGHHMYLFIFNLFMLYAYVVYIFNLFMFF